MQAKKLQKVKKINYKFINKMQPTLKMDNVSNTMTETKPIIVSHHIWFKLIGICKVV